MIRQRADSPGAATTPFSQPIQQDSVADLLDLTPDGRVGSPATDASVGGYTGDIVDEWGRQSFPASDPPANW